MDVDPRWYSKFFEGEWLDTLVPSLAARHPERATEMVEFAVDRLGLEPGARVLDLACGHGRHSVELAKRGFRVTGLDLSPRSLEVAARAAEEAGVDVEWAHADMREPPAGPFDAVVNLWTSFGYLESDAENQRVLDAAARVLVPGGRLLIDTVNAHGLVRAFRDRSWSEEGDGTVMLHDARFDHRRGRNTVRWELIHGDGRRAALEHDLRIYALHELADMLERAGLEVDGWWGGYDGSELTFDSWRLIVRARDPA